MVTVRPIERALFFTRLHDVTSQKTTVVLDCDFYATLIIAISFLVTLISVYCISGVCGRSLAGIVGSNPARVIDVCLL
jgi:hypothetical protein